MKNSILIALMFFLGSYTYANEEKDLVLKDARLEQSDNLSETSEAQNVSTVKAQDPVLTKIEELPTAKIEDTKCPFILKKFKYHADLGQKDEAIKTIKENTQCMPFWITRGLFPLPQPEWFEALDIVVETRKAIAKDDSLDLSFDAKESSYLDVFYNHPYLTLTATGTVVLGVTIWWNPMLALNVMTPIIIAIYNKPALVGHSNKLLKNLKVTIAHKVLTSGYHSDSDPDYSPEESDDASSTYSSSSGSDTELE